MASTYILIEKITVGAAGASAVTFSSIPQNYTDLKILGSARTTSATGNWTELTLSLNGVATNMNARELYGSGGSGTATSDASSSIIWAGYATNANSTAGVYGNFETHIPNYSSSSVYKTISADCVTENNASSSLVLFETGLWASTAAITSVTYTPGVGSLVSGSTFYLYGISNSTTSITGQGFPYATGGDIIKTDGTYWYHAFLSSGTFTPQKNNLSCDALIVAGGGAGGAVIGGGGGAGGLQLFTSQTLTTNVPYTVLVGAGGSGTSVDTQGGTGGNSSISGFSLNLVSVGGGGGGGGLSGQPSKSVGNPGGSGGGASAGGQAGSGVGGSGVPGQGNSGGSSPGSGASLGAGGGGANGVGANSGSTGTAGAGGAGAGGTGFTNYAILDAMGVTTGTGVLSSSHYYYAGGGAGGARSGNTGGNGGLGGGANGTNSDSTPSAATANTGGGGGGSGYVSGQAAGGNGGSGLVIVRYAV
jgi:hypothetical protein